MTEISRTGGASPDARAPTARAIATFKLAAPTIVMVFRRADASEARGAANINRIGVVGPGAS